MRVLIVGAGLFGSTCAYELSKAGNEVDVIDKRNHIGGNVYTKEILGIPVHVYGAHIFHTSNSEVWKFMKTFSQFNSFINSPIAKVQGKIFHLPFNMNTFYELYGAVTPKQAKEAIKNDSQGITDPRNAEEMAIKKVGATTYHALIKGYTEKQWHMPCSELPPEILARIPVRFTFNNNYFTDEYQGIPTNGYTPIIQKMLSRVHSILLNTGFSEIQDSLSKYDLVLYTGPIDEYFNYKYGKLKYRSLKFVHSIYPNSKPKQGNAVFNYTGSSVKYTRTIEHAYFYGMDDNKGTVITTEYPSDNGDKYYPVNNDLNNRMLEKYQKLAYKQNKENTKKYKVIFGGRLGTYSYLNMDQVVGQALMTSKKVITTSEYLDYFGGVNFGH